ncbi:hypothetical protein Q4610_19965 [Sphingobium sp. HBC34]|uniref:DUF6878 domain-containing protein n=1 Tax=Sphingobium cyanobacteriorum TaxID=3063954 RepID=A0ABT8ZV53_9SPHN|nr:DUF6878 family protein [Sphingobium sp. HBC34]MDO7837326.1 hypothetical protein [Sphingobium sp. HBC34]
MTTIQPASPEPQVTPFTFDFTFDYDAWIAEDAKRRAAFAEELVGLKASLFDFLQAKSIILVTVDFDGSGDSGQIEDMFAFDAQGEVALPEDKLSVAGANSPADGDADERGRVKDVIETLAYDLLEGEHGGWENNEGAYGEFRFDVTERIITLGYHERMMATEYSETTW